VSGVQRDRDTPGGPPSPPAAAASEASEGVFAALWPGSASLPRDFLRSADGEVLSYAELRAQSARLAHALVALGVRPGDRVAVQVEKSLLAVLLYFAVMRTGAVYVPLNSAYTAAELRYFLTDAQPVLFVSPEQLQALALAMQEQPPVFEDARLRASDPAAILYTSGTTGRSKGAVLTHGNLVSNARALAALWRFTPGDVLLHALPIFHVHGLFVAINVAFAAGSSLRFLPKFEPSAVLRHLRDCSVMMGVPTFYVRLLREPGLTREALGGVRLFVSGSAPLLVETHRAWQQSTGHVILERYGLSETGMNCSNPYDGERVPGSVGLPLPGVELRITDPASGAPLPAESVGMIEVRGPNVFEGYWRAPDRTHVARRADGFFVTGDIGRVDARGYVYIVGRATDMIISGGYNVYPREVETELDELPGVQESAVVGLPHPEWGEAVTAFVVPSAGAATTATAASAGQPCGALTESDIIAALRGRLAPYKLPKRALFVTELPRNVMGKVQKAQLRAQYAHLYTG
jgi:malonyl-CoA/methylmalonyl-CoA synthetase